MLVNTIVSLFLFSLQGSTLTWSHFFSPVGQEPEPEQQINAPSCDEADMHLIQKHSDQRVLLCVCVSAMKMEQGSEDGV